MVSLKECHECGRRESTTGVVRNHRVLQPSGKYATMRLCYDCWQEVKLMGWDWKR